MRRIGVLTSGGDAPGMNAAVRAVVRSGVDKGWNVHGVRRGYAGLIAGDFVQFGPRDVGGIIQQGGTILGTSRCEEFTTKAGRAKAIAALERQAIDALVVIGGDGSQTGAYHLSQTGYPVVGIASTIDNDLFGSEISIGVDTALNVALEAIDRLKVTASSHHRAFLVEVMGRNCGYLALMAGIAGGAEVIVIPEVELSPDQIACEFRNGYERGKRHAIAVVAEGARYNAQRLADYFKENHERLGFDLRITRLGHVQRGGAPGAFDRLLATRFGVAAIGQLAQGRGGVLIGLLKDEISVTPFSEILANKKPLDLRLLEMARILAR
ncbi:MAG TPA: 6-phosphofructokinase [Candidatus Binatia bacterium]